jgi:hypothetical protein
MRSAVRCVLRRAQERSARAFRAPTFHQGRVSRETEAVQQDVGDVDEPVTPEDVLTVLRLYAGENDEEQIARFDNELIRLADRDREQMAATASEALGGARGSRLRGAAIYALGRAAEGADVRLVDHIEATILRHARGHEEAVEAEAVATALLHVWSQKDDATFARELRFATDSRPSLRLAAAKSLALATDVPMPEALVTTVRQLADDPDPSVQAWGRIALSYIEDGA